MPTTYKPSPLIRITALIFAVLMLSLVACNTGSGALPLPGVTIVDVSSGTLAPGDEVTITGTGFYDIALTARTGIDVCGVNVPAVLVDPITQQVVLPSGDTVTVQTGSTLTFYLPETGFTGGEGQVLTVTRPDGSTATRTGITCLAPGNQPKPTPVTAVLTANATVAVAPATFRFSAADSTGEGELMYSWDFGDEAGISNEAEPEYTYETAGTFTVVLTVTDETGVTDTDSEVVTVNPSVQAVISGPGIANFGQDVTYTAGDSRGEGSLSYEWRVDGAIVGKDESVTHVFTQAGTEDLILTVTDGRGVTDTALLTVDVWIPITLTTTPGDLVIESLPIRTSTQSGDHLIAPERGLAPLQVFLPVATDPEVHVFRSPAMASRSVTVMVHGTAYVFNEWYVKSSGSESFYANPHNPTTAIPAGFFGSPETGSISITALNLPSGSASTHTVVRWGATGWQTVSSPDFGSLVPGVYELRADPVHVPVEFTGEVATFTAEPVRFTVDSDESTPVTVDYRLPVPVPTFTFHPENPVAGEEFTLDGSGTLGTPSAGDGIVYNFSVLLSGSRIQPILNPTGLSPHIRKHSFKEPGTYEIRLIVRYANAPQPYETGRVVRSITVPAVP